MLGDALAYQWKSPGVCGPYCDLGTLEEERISGVWLILSRPMEYGIEDNRHGIIQKGASRQHQFNFDHALAPKKVLFETRFS